MPKTAEFSEKEYEIALSAELIDSDYPLRSPGQVLENYFGFEAILSITKLDFWGRLEYSAPLQGDILTDLNFGYVWRRLGSKRPLPNFSANLFLLAHCPEYLLRRSARLSKTDVQAPFWRFDIQDEFQRVLSKLQSRLPDRTLMMSAGPAFVSLDDLYKHVHESSITENSTFVHNDSLAGQEKWIFNKSGCEGWVYPDVETVKNVTFRTQLELLEALAQEFSGDTEALVLQLHVLERAVIEVCAEEAQEENRRAVEILRRIQMIESRNTENDLLDQAIRSYVKVRAFTSGYHLIWCTVG